VHELCPNARIHRRCHEIGIKQAGLRQTELDSCVQATFVNNGTVLYVDDDNSLFSQNAKEWRDLGTHLYPAVYINGVKFKGQINPENVFEALCFGFIEMPSGCRKFMKKEGIVLQDSGITTPELLLVIGILLTVNMVIFVFYRSHLKKELKSEMKM